MRQGAKSLEESPVHDWNLVIGSDMTNIAAITIKSKELEIPFENVLAGYLLEEIISVLYESEFQKDFYLTSTENLGLESYRRKIPDRIQLIYLENEKVTEKQGLIPGQRLVGEFQEAYVKWFISKLREKNILVTEHKLQYQEHQKELQITLMILYENIPVPFHIYIKSRQQLEGFAKEKKLRLLMENNKWLTYEQYSLERLAAEHLYEILKNMELLNEMEHYLYLFDEISEESLEGRKVKDLLMKLCDSSSLSMTEKRWTMLQGYRDYSYMKKKWKVLLRRESRVTPTWEDTMDKIIKFLEPIYESMLRDDVFFGDWMPELERFL